MRRTAAVLVVGLSLACRNAQPPSDAITFVHATDPHLFEDSTEHGKDTSPAVRARDSTRRTVQGRLNAQALASLLTAMKALPAADAPSFLVMTGDFGVDYTWGSPDTVSRDTAQQRRRRALLASQVDTTAALLRASPVRDIYVVPGNNDVGGESPTAAAVAASGRFFDSVQARLRNFETGVVIHNLGACYAREGGDASGCTADIPGTSLRLIGFPSWSFKNAQKSADTAADERVDTAQQRQVTEFQAMVIRGVEERKRMLVLSHIPWLDDPYYLARARFAADTHPGFGAAPRQWSTWNVSPQVVAAATRALQTPAVKAVLAGHFHDPHHEIYLPPYSWSAPASAMPPPEKLLIAPPLSVRLQENSPIQARGFALIRVADDSVPKRTLYWYDAQSDQFKPDPSVSASAQAPGRAAPDWLAAMWGLGRIDPLNRAALVAVAFLAALLTVIYIWKIGEVRSELTSAASTAKDTPTNAATANAPTPSPSNTTPADGDGPFSNRIGKAALAGIGGLAVITVLGDLSGLKDAKAYYTVIFVILFVVLLVLAGIFQGSVEAVRSRMVAYRPLPLAVGQPERFLVWLRSFVPTLLVFLDNLVNVVLGRNRLESTVLADEIYRLQWALANVAERVRKEVNGAVLRGLAQECKDQVIDHSAVRVGISVYQPRRDTVRYVSSAPGSLSTEFTRNSVAWVAVYYGVALWWKQRYMEPSALESIVLHKPDDAKLAALLLKDNFEQRDRSDYEAFIIIPVPWGRRGYVERYQRGAIHISFRKEEYLGLLFDNLEVEGGTEKSRLPNYARAHWLGMLEEPSVPCKPDADVAGSPPVAPSQPGLQLRPKHGELRAVLRTAVEVLGESLRFYNESVFNYLRAPMDLR